MSSHTLRLILPGSTEPAEPVTTASATITNLHYPHARGELSGGGGLTLAEWENATFNTTMSPVFDIAHVFTAPVRSFTNGLHGQTSELTMAAQHLTGILYGYFESVGLGDYPLDPQWGEVFLFTKQSIPSINGLYIALPGDVQPPAAPDAFSIKVSDGNGDEDCSSSEGETEDDGQVHLSHCLLHVF